MIYGSPWPSLIFRLDPTRERANKSPVIGSTLIIGVALLLAFNSSFRLLLVHAGENLWNFFLLCIKPGRIEASISASNELVLRHHRTDLSNPEPRASRVIEKPMLRQRTTVMSDASSHEHSSWWQKVLFCVRHWTIWGGFLDTTSGRIVEDIPFDTPSRDLELGRSVDEEHRKESDYQFVLISPDRQLEGLERLASGSNAEDTKHPVSSLPQRRSLERRQTG